MMTFREFLEKQARRQNHKDRAQTLRDHLDVHIAAVHHEALI